MACLSDSEQATNDDLDLVNAVLACEQRLALKSNESDDNEIEPAKSQALPSEKILPSNISPTNRYDELEEKIKKQRETLRKLKLVKTYKEKNNLETLDKLITKWRNASQTALMELLELAPKDQPTTLGQLIGFLGIDCQTIKFDLQNQCFVCDELKMDSNTCIS